MSTPLRQGVSPVRLAAVVALTGTLLLAFSPIGSIAAAGIQSATQTVITTVKRSFPRVKNPRREAEAYE